ncbi:shikimate kinase [Candidatus Contubernalis alkaliaceticus]|uniref:shikimate kinase n=1 Tax=Candidatus Contubernalis alkaliaceticus TaxID=338645 RepID=UPI001F4C1AD6|nr:shikimate kinase [Candidatus Contubernalis alkalaceticus]UNC92563.1 shikimate kinase [Candidatus Contubernalis alkalaceticus]
MRNIIISGFMGTGKTVTGIKLSQYLKCPFIDIDAVVEEMEMKSISNIFKEKGEDYFRKLETQAIKRVLKREGQVISTGGGSLLKQENRKLLKDGGLLFCLSASPEEIYRRVGGAGGRPLLEGKDPLNKIRMILSERQSIYNEVSHSIETDGKSPEEVAKRIFKIVKELEGK